MNNYNIDWDIETKSDLTVSISNAGISFTKNSIDALNKCDKVMLGIDKDKKILFVKEAQGAESHSTYNFCTNPKRENWLRIQSKGFMEELTKYTDSAKNNKSKKYKAKLDRENKMLIVDLNN